MASQVSRVLILPSQAEGLASACAIGKQQLNALADVIEAQPPTILQKKLTEMIKAEVGDNEGSALSHLLLGMAASVSRDATKISGFLDGVTNTVESTMKENPRLATWVDCRPGVERLLRTASVLLSAKAIDVSYDFERVLLAPRVITSIRPIYTVTRDAIVGTTIVHTLRLDYYTSSGEEDSISIAIDLGDIKQILKVCNEAVDKAELAKAKLNESWGEVLVPGEELL